jgi:signal transduction histidine kinase
LEQRVAERTRELTVANAQLTELDQLKDEFIARISHELRTPMTRIKIYGQLLETAGPDKVNAYVKTLRRETARLQQLIEDLLNVSKLGYDPEPLRLTPVDLNQLAVDLVTDRPELARARFDADVRAGSLTADLPIRCEADCPGAASPAGERHQLHTTRWSGHRLHGPPRGRRRRVDYVCRGGYRPRYFAGRAAAYLHAVLSRRSGPRL